MLSSDALHAAFKQHFGLAFDHRGINFGKPGRLASLPGGMTNAAQVLP